MQRPPGDRKSLPSHLQVAPIAAPDTSRLTLLSQQICSNFSSGMWWVFTYRCPFGYICIDNGGVTGPHCVQVMAPCNPNCGDEEIAAAVEAAYAAHPKAIEAEEEGKKEGEVVASSFVA